MTSTLFTIDEEEFVRHFRPVPNRLHDNASFDLGNGGCLFEAYGAELDHIRLQPAEHIWTILDVDGKLMIVSGYHFVNRIGYVLTERPWPENTITKV